jgi:ferric-dicitrate binding protein FerR (iron transport regulator)
MTQRLNHLVDLYFLNNISPTEKEELAALILQATDEELQAALEKAWSAHQPGADLPGDRSDDAIEPLLRQLIRDHPTENALTGKSKNIHWWKISLAAACLLGIIFLGYSWLYHSSPVPVATTATQPKTLVNDVAPGGQKALLTLADGTQILLDSATTGLLAQQGNSQVKKLSSGEIAYSSSQETPAAVLFNTMSTPPGGTYQLILPDGSRVWLNSASSIRYPTAFNGAERRVQITGEAYFEVAKNASKPFFVTINNIAEVNVLGTHFNVNAYTDEAEIRTTLIEGAVNVLQGKNSSKLVPGQQARINKNGSIKRVDDVDLDEAIAWTKGNFLFNSAPLAAVLRQASRWYDLEIVYEGGIPDDKFSGQIPKSVNLSNLLKWMQWSGINFKLSGKKLFIRDTK